MRLLRAPTCHRALLLTLLSTITLLLGVRYMRAPSGAELGLLAAYADATTYGWIFIAAGAVGVSAALLNVGWDSIGLAPMAGLWMFWSLGHVFTVFDPRFPDYIVGRQIALGMIFLLLAIVVVIVADLPDTRISRK